MARRRQRASVWLAASGGIATIVAGFFYWEELLYRYHMSRLRGDARHVGQIAGSRVGNPAQRALDEFLRMRVGKEALFQCYVSHLTEEIDYVDSQALQRWLGTVQGGRVWYDTSYSGRRLPEGGEYCVEHDRFVHLQELLHRIEGESFSSPGAKGYEFSILSVDAATKLYRRSVPAQDLGSIVFSGAASFVCRVRRMDQP